MNTGSSLLGGRGAHARIRTGDLFLTKESLTEGATPPADCRQLAERNISIFVSDLENCDPAVIHRHRCTSRDTGIVFRNWSGARDLNPGPHGPEPCALPNCASPRRGDSIRPRSRLGFRSSPASPSHPPLVTRRRGSQCRPTHRRATVSSCPLCRRCGSARQASAAGGS
jgi:hypothetical protein